MIPSLSAPAHAISAIGKNFIVTGGSQGLGYAIAEQLAGAGADNIAILARTKSTGEAAAEKLSSLNPNTKAHFYATNLSDPASIKASCASTIRDLSKISGLVNAAATTERGNLETTTSDDFDWQMICNARGPFLMSQAISNHMKSEKIRGSIVNITSVASKVRSCEEQSHCSRSLSNVMLVVGWRPLHHGLQHVKGRPRMYDPQQRRGAGSSRHPRQRRCDGVVLHRK